MSYRAPLLALLAAALAAPALAAQLSPISPACQTGTAIQQTACQAKLGLYQSYMTQLGAGVSLRGLPALYRDVLGPHFGAPNLLVHRFGYSNRQPANNATTDCQTTYYNDASMVNWTASGDLSDSKFIGWLLHELAHVEQCAAVGGRDFYARMWFDQLQQTQISVTWPPAPGTLDWMTIHDQMAMEQQADAKRVAVWGAINACCIDQTGRIIRPLAITGLSVATDPATSSNNFPKKILTVTTSGGAQPLAYAWQIKKPGQSSFQSVTAADGTVSGNQFTWVGVATTGSGMNMQVIIGTYEFRARVSQARTSLPTAERTVAITVSPPTPAVTGVVTKPPADR